MKIARWVIYLALAAAVVYGGYLAYIQWVQGKPLSDLWQKAQQYASSTAGMGKQVNDTVSSVQQTVQSVQSTTASATSALETVKAAVGGALSGLGGDIQNLASGLSGASPTASAPVPLGTAPAPTTPAFFVPPPPATVTTGVGVPLYFSLNSGTSYSIAWGDGATGTGSLDANAVTVVEHSWAAAGDYVVKVAIGSGSYTFPIRVYQN